MTNYNITYEEIYNLLHHMCTTISPDVLQLMQQAAERETKSEAKTLLTTMLENVAQAGKKDKPVCQSPGFPTVYVRFGDAADLTHIPDFVSRAIKECTSKGYLRPSIVHPLTRKNSGDNSGVGVPNMEYRYCPGQQYLEIITSAKGCGAELANKAAILTPAKLGKNYIGLKKLVLDTVVKGGGFPCPPSALGIGIGGQMDVSAKLSREVISTRDWRDRHSDPMIAALEEELLTNINALGMGPAGIGGDTTCLAVKIGYAYTHTAICPVTINFHCWVARRFGVRFYPDGSRKYLFQEDM